jgi:uncharacterized protein (DUF433 family)
MELKHLDRITFDPAIMGGKPCIRGMRVTVGMIVGMLATGPELMTYLPAYDDRSAVEPAGAAGTWRPR